MPFNSCNTVPFCCPLPLDAKWAYETQGVFEPAHIELHQSGLMGQDVSLIQQGGCFSTQKKQGLIELWAYLSLHILG